MARREECWYSNAGIVTCVIEHAGADNWLYLAPVSRCWKKAYQAFDPNSRRTTIQKGTDAVLRYSLDGGYKMWCRWEDLARKGYLETLKHFIEILKIKCDEWWRVYAAAARAGHLEVLQWIREKGFEWGRGTFAAAARGGHLEVLQWMKAQGCEWDGKTCAAAARAGHLEVLQWVRAQGCPWDEDTCRWAARGGHLELLQWVRAQGCPWNKWTWSAADAGKHMEVLQWIKAQGCPCYVSCVNIY